jgi:pyruvate/2-oxoglutarate dehydrogenase complex dihydrolipoamide dehydrogenase (E3) component
MPWEFNRPKSVVEENEAVVSSKTSVSTPSSRPGRVLGVSIIGEQAEELIHIG